MSILRLILLVSIFFILLDGNARVLQIRTGQYNPETTRVVLDCTEKYHFEQRITNSVLEIGLQSKAPIFSQTLTKNQSKEFRRIAVPLDETKSSISFHFSNPLKVTNAYWISPTPNHLSYRYVVDLKKDDGPIPRMPEKITQKKTIIIDAGHGGKDPGTIGYKNLYEKNITLACAKLLANTLEGTGRYKAILIRDRDTSMTLTERLNKIRATKGDLFISLHADSCDQKDMRGLSVYTLSSVASDRQAERLAAKENKADLIMGVDLSKEIPEVAHILIDLTKREKMTLSVKLASSVIAQLRERVFLLRKPHRSANFVILRLPGLPSVLVELGYLSNPKDANLLKSIQHQQTICSGLVDAIDNYFKHT